MVNKNSNEFTKCIYWLTEAITTKNTCFFANPFAERLNKINGRNPSVVRNMNRYSGDD